MPLLTTTPSRTKAVITAALTAFAPVLADLTNEAGAPYDTPPVLRAAYADPVSTYPSLSIGYLPGHAREWLGWGLLEIDPVSHLGTYLQQDLDGTLQLTIRTRREAERIWLFDWFDAGLRAAAISDPTTGQVIAGIVKWSLAAANIMVKEEPAATPPPPDPNEERPAGMRWDTMLSVRVDVWLPHTVDFTSTLAMTKSVTFLPAPVPAGQAPIQEPPITVPPPLVPAPSDA